MNQEPLEQYIREDGLALVRFAYALCGDRDLAEDLAQTAFEKVARRRIQLDIRSNIEGYLRKTVTRTYIDWTRRASFNERVTTPNSAILTGQVEPQPFETGIAEQLWDAMADLPPKQRSTLVLRYYLDLDDREIAHVVGCRPSTVRSNIARGLLRLRSHLAADPRHHDTKEGKNCGH